MDKLIDKLSEIRWANKLMMKLDEWHLLNFLLKVFRFSIVGATAFLIDIFLMWLLTDLLHVHYLISAIFAFVVSTSYNYIFSIRWVYNIREFRDHTHQMLLFRDEQKVFEFRIRWNAKLLRVFVFFVMGGGGMVLNELILWLSVSKIGMHYLIAKVISGAIVMVYNFLTKCLFLEGSVYQK